LIASFSGDVIFSRIRVLARRDEVIEDVLLLPSNMAA